MEFSQVQVKCSKRNCKTSWVRKHILTVNVFANSHFVNSLNITNLINDDIKCQKLNLAACKTLSSLIHFKQISGTR